MSDFSFSHSVFKRHVLQTHENQGLFGNGLSNLYLRNPLIATFQLSSAASLNLGWYQNGVLGNWLSLYMFSMLSVSSDPLIATFQLSSAAYLNLGWSQNGVFGDGFKVRIVCIDLNFLPRLYFRVNPLPDDKF